MSMISIEMTADEQAILDAVAGTPTVQQLARLDPVAAVQAAVAEMSPAYARRALAAVKELIDRRTAELDEALGALGSSPSIGAVQAVYAQRALVELKQRALDRAAAELDGLAKS